MKNYKVRAIFMVLGVLSDVIEKDFSWYWAACIYGFFMHNFYGYSCTIYVGKPQEEINTILEAQKKRARKASRFLPKKN